MIEPVKIAWMEGFLISVIDEENLELVLEENNLVFGFENQKLPAESERIDHPNIELRTYLQHGFPDNSQMTPPVGVISPDPAKVMLRARELDEHITQEVEERRLSAPRRLPQYLPFRTVPAYFVDREEGGDRLVINASYPPKDAFGGAVNLRDGTIIPLDANSNTTKPNHLAFDWPSIESLAEIIAVQCEAARMARQQLLGRTCDCSNWFRMLAVQRSDRWKGLVLGKSGYHEDFCLQMGRASAAFSGHRTTTLISELIEERAWKEDWAGVFTPQPKGKGMKDVDRQVLKAWSSDREEKCGADERQQRFVTVTPFQDDLVVTAIGEKAAERVNAGIEEFMEEFGVRLSRKQKASRPFSTTLLALGAEFDLAASPPWNRPPSDKVEKLERLLNELMPFKNL